MTDHLDTLLRDVLDDLATSAPTPADLAGPAVRQARRQRSRRFAVASSATALLVAAVIGAGAVAFRPPEPTLPIELSRPNMILSYCGIVHDPCATTNYSRLWNPATSAYDKTPYSCAVPSPDGRKVLVTPPRSPLDATPPRLASASGTAAAARSAGSICSGSSSTTAWRPPGHRMASGCSSRGGRAAWTVHPTARPRWC